MTFLLKMLFETWIVGSHFAGRRKGSVVSLARWGMFWVPRGLGVLAVVYMGLEEPIQVAIAVGRVEAAHMQ